MEANLRPRPTAGREVDSVEDKEATGEDVLGVDADAHAAIGHLLCGVDAHDDVPVVVHRDEVVLALQEMSIWSGGYGRNTHRCVLVHISDRAVCWIGGRPEVPAIEERVAGLRNHQDRAIIKGFISPSPS